MEFLAPLVRDMIQTDPSRRPAINEVVRQFHVGEVGHVAGDRRQTITGSCEQGGRSRIDEGGIRLGDVVVKGAVQSLRAHQ